MDEYFIASFYCTPNDDRKIQISPEITELNKYLIMNVHFHI